MAEPLRRRVRARALDALTRLAGSPFDPLLGVALAAGARAAQRTSAARRIERNLALAYGAELDAQAREKLVREVLAHTARLVREWLWMARAGRSERERQRVERWIDASVEFDASCDELRRRATRGRGVLIVTAHLGNWELLAAALRRAGLDGAVVGLRKRNDSSADWLVGLRAGLGVRSLAQDSSPRDVLNVLRDGATLGLLCDLHARRLDNVDAPFFGRLAPTMTAPAALARASGLPLTPVRCVREGARYRIRVDEPLELAASSDKRAAALDLLTRMNAVFERWIRAAPEQWAWHQRRWPADEHVDGAEQNDGA
jgi:KDO2-lipid IV(A) lauroyltransferase